MQRIYSVGERVADGTIHVIGVVGGLIAATALVTVAIMTLPVSETVSVAVYAVAMVAMFGFSAAYNVIDFPQWKETLRRYDQAAIFAKIAGTYTPLAFAKIGGFAGTGLLVGVWSVAVLGIVGKLALSRRWDRTSLVLYLALGWAGVLTIGPVIDSLPLVSLVLLVIGGVTYTVGVVFHLWSSLPYQNAIWHLFVLVATALHFSAIAWAVFE
ncbi:MAG: hemolysin III family protein [Pseudomonadota bacterium]